MTATEDLYARRLVSDGFFAVSNDVNYTNGMISARLFDQLIGQIVGSRTDTDLEFPSYKATDASTAYAVALHAGRAFPYASGNGQVTISPGTLLQKVAASTGAEEQLLAYTFDGTSATQSVVSVAAGDPSNPRVDIIEVNLALVSGDNVTMAFDSGTPPNVNIVEQSGPTTRRVNATVVYKQGVAAASPVYPDPDPGYVVIAGIVVGANYNPSTTTPVYYDTAGAVAVLHDQRMPLRLTARQVEPVNFVALKYTTSFFPISPNDGEAGDIGSGHAPLWTGGFAALFPGWQFQSGGASCVDYAVRAKAGDTIAGYQVSANKTNAGVALTARLYHYDPTTPGSAAVGVSPGTSNSGSGGYLPLGETGLAVQVASDTDVYFIRVTGGTGGGTQDTVSGATWFPGGGWATSVVAPDYLQALDAVTPARVPCPAHMIGRIVGVAMESTHFAGTQRAFLSQVSLGTTGLETVDNSVDVTGVVTAGVTIRYKKNIYVLDAGGAVHNPSAGPTVQASATNKIGVPVWTSGYRVPFPEAAANGSPFGIQPVKTQLSIIPSGTTCAIGRATWLIAEGL